MLLSQQPSSTVTVPDVLFQPSAAYKALPNISTGKCTRNSA
jgi:hypothetical protein